MNTVTYKFDVQARRVDIHHMTSCVALAAKHHLIYNLLVSVATATGIRVIHKALHSQADVGGVKFILLDSCHRHRWIHKHQQHQLQGVLCMDGK